MHVACWMAGRMRDVSSSGGTNCAPGRVDAPPMSIMSEAVRSGGVKDCSGVVGLWIPPSEKEFGVKFRIVMIFVRRSGRSGVSGGVVVERYVSGVVKEADGGSVLERLRRCWWNVVPFLALGCSSDGMSLGLR
jgi:hypothetical protein